MSNNAIGMMEGAFFVSKTDIINWVNSLLQLNLNKIEQCATGAVYCQIVDALYPGTVPLNKVNWQAKHQYEFVANYKVLQQAFDKNNINKYIEVDKLVKAKYQDNLEFLQWFKRFFDINYAGHSYNAYTKRKGAQLHLIGNQSNNQQLVSQRQAKQSSRNMTNSPSPINNRKPLISITTPQNQCQNHLLSPQVNSFLMSNQKQVDTQEAEQLVELKEQIELLKMQVQIEKTEKELYFNKLSQIDSYLTKMNDCSNEIVIGIQSILYQCDDENASMRLNNASTCIDQF